MLHFLVKTVTWQSGLEDLCQDVKMYEGPILSIEVESRVNLKIGKQCSDSCLFQRPIVKVSFHEAKVNF